MQSHPNLPAISAEAVHIPYRDTGFFSGLVTDYLDNDPRLHPFFTYRPDHAGLRKAIDDRASYTYHREALVNALEKQYEEIRQPQQLKHNLALLRNNNCFTITTAHQPNIFTGPLYFIYKILHTIRLAATLKKQLPGFDFVPVFFMGSEDADLDELGHFTVDGKRYDWKTKQVGAVGRMKVDKGFTKLIDELEGQLSVHTHGKEAIEIFRKAYAEGETIQQCTLGLVNALFGEYGLVVLIPDNAALKKIFHPVVAKELREQFSHKAVAATVTELGKTYKVQAGGRELNLFYLVDDKRERIEIQNSRLNDIVGQAKFKIQNTTIEFSEAEILQELEQHPERFSPNVILRGVFQEMILPNIAFIGGGGEIAYWLELKQVFADAGVPYPALVLRNSFLVLSTAHRVLLNELGFETSDIFKSDTELLNELVRRESVNPVSLSEEKGELNSFYQQLHETALKTDASLAEHVNALQAKAIRKLEALEKKMLRAEKRKFEAEKHRIQKLKAREFPGGNLQERVENLAGFYARYGPAFIENIYRNSLSLEQQFTVVTT
jgi:bacillithiol synthase